MPGLWRLKLPTPSGSRNRNPTSHLNFHKEIFDMSTPIKLAALVIVAVAAVPAIASAQNGTPGNRAGAHYSRIKPDVYASTRAPQQSMVVTPTGRSLGTDPDPNIRFDLNRDWSRGDAQ
jgi:hypothetical protein